MKKMLIIGAILCLGLLTYAQKSVLTTTSKPVPSNHLIPGSQVNAQPLHYKALLVQFNTNDPIAHVLVNELGGEVVWTRKQPGVYVGTLMDAFPNESYIFGLREWHLIPTNAGGVARWKLQWNDTDPDPDHLGDSLLLDVFNVTENAYQDGLLNANPVSFEVYPMP